MPKHHAALLAGAATLAFAILSPAAAVGQEWHTTTAALPDGSTAEIRYAGDVPPQVTIAMEPAPDWRRRAAGGLAQDAWTEADAGYGGIPRARRIIQPRAAPAAPQAALPQFVVPKDAPRGATYHYTLITTGTDGKVCVQRNEWISRGRSKEPEVRQSNAGEGCAGTRALPAPPPPPQSAPAHPPIQVDPDAF